MVPPKRSRRRHQLATGFTLNSWTVIADKGYKEVHVKCICGNTSVVNRWGLRAGITKSCDRGKCKSSFKNLAGNTYGLLTATSTFELKGNHTFWLAKCTCGTEKMYRSDSLIGGVNTDCGCLTATKQYRTRYGSSGEDCVVRKIHSRYKNSSNGRKHSFELTVEDVRSIVFRACYYCGRPPQAKLSKSYSDGAEYCEDTPPDSTGIDRVDNNKGYTILNCVPCCKTCNLSKSKMPAKEFVDHFIGLVANQIKLGNKEALETIKVAMVELSKASTTVECVGA